MIPLHQRYLPKRIRRCPSCGDRDEVQYIVEGMPAYPPHPDEADRIYFAGCVIEVDLDEQGEPLPNPRWYCPACDLFFR